MIELRWLKDPKAQPIYDIGEELGVLQYRYKYPYPDDNINSYPPERWHWSDWQDVPTVSEADGTFTARVDVTSRNIG